MRFTSINVNIEIFCLTELVNMILKYTVTNNYDDFEKYLKFGYSLNLVYFSS